MRDTCSIGAVRCVTMMPRFAAAALALTLPAAAANHALATTARTDHDSVRWNQCAGVRVADSRCVCYSSSSTKATRVSAKSDDVPTAAGRLDGLHVLYNNDAENLLTVRSPYHHEMDPINASVIRGSERDTRGAVDGNLITPFHGVPWWNSTIESPAAHRDWYDKTFGFNYGDNGGTQLDFILRGGDLVGTFVDEVHAEGQKSLISFNLNDGQMCACPPTPNNYTSMNANEHTFSYISRTFYEHRFDKEVPASFLSILVASLP